MDEFKQEKKLGGARENLGFACLDHERSARRGFPEVIYGPGKTTEQLLQIFQSLSERNPNVLATRVEAESAQAVCERCPDAEYDPIAKLLYCWRSREDRGWGKILVISAGTSDQGAAQEAFLSAQIMGNRCDTIRDVGVAGLHRLLAHVDALREASVIICVAGLEAALVSVVAGLVDVPVIAVPTSVGYGTSFNGVAALLGCLNSCASGVTTVNVDNGFGAAYSASLINRRRGE